MKCYKCGNKIDDDSRYCEYCGAELVVEQTHEKVANSQGDSSTHNRLNGFEYVDLGLPSGLKWATCNVGAERPEEYGCYFAWGETDNKFSYTESNSVTYGKSMSQLRTSGILDGEGNLTPAYDAATQNWGSSWRMPTYDETKELLENTKHKWTTKNRVRGWKLTSKLNGNFIFLPAAGCGFGSSLYNQGKFGYYWLLSSSKGYNQPYRLFFCIGNSGLNYHDSYYGFPVRPVLE